MNYPVAVIIPVYKNDTPQYVRPAIDSIIKQTYSCRIYIGVDGPIGNSLNSCLEAYENNKNVSIVRFAENRGLACVLNDLLQICFDTGYEYIARMDADDISDRERELVNAPRRDPERESNRVRIVRGTCEGDPHR